MANYYATTVSSGGKLKDKNEEKVKEIIANYTFGDGQGDLNVEIETKLRGEKYIEVWGESATCAYRKEDIDQEDGEVFDQFLKEVAPFLAEPLVVSEVGNEKCRYVQAYAYIAKPNGEVVSVSLSDLVEKELKK